MCGSDCADECCHPRREARAAARAVVISYLTELQASMRDVHRRTERRLHQPFDDNGGQFLPCVNGVNIHADVEAGLIEASDIVPACRVCDRQLHFGELIGHQIEIRL